MFNAASEPSRGCGRQKKWAKVGDFWSPALSAGSLVPFIHCHTYRAPKGLASRLATFRPESTSDSLLRRRRRARYGTGSWSRKIQEGQKECMSRGGKKWLAGPKGGRLASGGQREVVIPAPPPIASMSAQVSKQSLADRRPVRPLTPRTDHSEEWGETRLLCTRDGAYRDAGGAMATLTPPP